MNKRLIIAVGLAVGLPALNVRAEFTGYYWIGNRGVAGAQTIPGGVSAPIAMGNWSFDSSSPIPRTVVRIQTSPEDALLPAQGFQLSSSAAVPSGVPGSVASFEIFAPTAGPGVVKDYIFTFNAGISALDKKAWYVDAAGVELPLVGTGQHTFHTTPGNTNDVYGFYVQFTGLVGGTDHTAVLQIQDWQPVPEPSAIAMGLITCLGAVGFVARRYRSRKG